MFRLLLLNGPNLSRLGKREPAIYGAATLADAERSALRRARAIGAKLVAFQSDTEGTLVSKINTSEGRFDGIIFNPGAYTHTSVALRDALQSVKVPCVEVHLSNTAARESFRQAGLTSGACVGQIMGFGIAGYALAVEALVDYLSRSAAGTVSRSGKARK